MVSYRIAQAGKAHTIAESLIKPCVTDIVSCMLDEKTAKKINTIPLSNDTVRRRINDISDHIKSELISRLKCNNFSLQMDESTDVSGLAVLLVFVRYKYQTSLEEDLLLCQPLSTYTTGYEIFKMLNTFFETEGLTWDTVLIFVQMGRRQWLEKLLAWFRELKK
ncbi:zinc finger BED domain-containing protein 5-like [Aphis gossypii]|uniref:zinc finger BED domain-containing protein 5-like n=1 Tax=Aphis gossypii TaxID=80765 RepID=UPI0021594979|nr:zinc finger BED domain-containing protein 5-like [Aphis gossypii]